MSAQSNTAGIDLNKLNHLLDLIRTPVSGFCDLAPVLADAIDALAERAEPAQATPECEQELPALPKAHGEVGGLRLWTIYDMREYARAARSDLLNAPNVAQFKDMRAGQLYDICCRQAHAVKEADKCIMRYQKKLEEARAALAASQRAAEPVALLHAIRDGVPLVEPVYVEKAMMAQRQARTVLDSGVGPRATVHLVNIGVTGWTHTKETAEAYAEGFNLGAKWLRSAILSYAAGLYRSAPPQQETQGDEKGAFLDTMRAMDFSVELNDEGEFRNESTNAMWVGWLERAKLGEVVASRSVQRISQARFNAKMDALDAANPGPLQRLLSTCEICAGTGTAFGKPCNHKESAHG